jgi:hypothetical protein
MTVANSELDLLFEKVLDHDYNHRFEREEHSGRTTPDRLVDAQ